jgi:hypothetical protein
MNPPFSKTLTAFFIFLPIFLFYSCSGKKYELTYVFQDGAQYTYLIESSQNTEIETGGDKKSYDSHGKVLLIQKTDSICRNNDAWFSFKYDSIQFEGTSGTDPTEKTIGHMKDKRPELKITEKGEIVDARGMENMTRQEISDFDLTKLMVKLFPIFPGKPVHAGAEWNREQRFPFENKLVKGEMLVYKHYKLDEVVPGNGGEIIKLKSVIRMKLDLPKDPNDRFAVKKHKNVDIGMLGTGTILYSTAKHLIVEAQADLSGRILIELKSPIDNEVISSHVYIKQKLKVTLK